jgi:hypothetical protein
MCTYIFPKPVFRFDINGILCVDKT